MKGVRGSVVGWGTTLQAGRSWDRIPDEVDFFNLPNPSSLRLDAVRFGSAHRFSCARSEKWKYSVRWA
jgi:hypothetical protein